MDLVAVSDETKGGFQENFQNVADFEQHPLCDQKFTENVWSSEVSSLPCCASIHCMLELDPFLQSWSRSDGVEERLLLMDSIYNPMTLLTNVTCIPPNPVLTDITRFSSKIGETEGAWLQQFLQSTYSSLPPLSKRVLWAITSTMTHTFLLPELQLEQLRCDVGGVQSGSTSTSVYQEDGVGFCGEIAMELYATFWVITQTWVLNTVQGDMISFRDLYTTIQYSLHLTKSETSPF